MVPIIPFRRASCGCLPCRAGRTENGRFRKFRPGFPPRPEQPCPSGTEAGSLELSPKIVFSFCYFSPNFWEVKPVIRQRSGKVLSFFDASCRLTPARKRHKINKVIPKYVLKEEKPWTVEVPATHPAVKAQNPDRGFASEDRPCVSLPVLAASKTFKEEPQWLNALRLSRRRC